MGTRVELGMPGPGMVQFIEDGMGRFESPEIGMRDIGRGRGRLLVLGGVVLGVRALLASEPVVA